MIYTQSLTDFKFIYWPWYLHKVLQTSNSYTDLDIYIKSNRLQIHIFTKLHRLHIHILALISTQSCTDFKFIYWPWYLHKVAQTSHSYTGFGIYTKSSRLQIHVLDLISTQSYRDFKFMCWTWYLHKIAQSSNSYTCLGFQHKVPQTSHSLNDTWCLTKSHHWLKIHTLERS